MATETVNQSWDDVLGRANVSGGRAAILRVSGIDVQEFPQVMDGSGSATVWKDGHQWTIKPWEGGGGFAVASRPETEEEIERGRRRMLRSTLVGYFGKDKAPWFPRHRTYSHVDFKFPLLKSIKFQQIMAGHGGRRKGAGRPAGSRNRPRLIHGLPETNDPLQWLLVMMNHPGAPLRLRMSAAKALLPYFHTCKC